MRKTRTYQLRKRAEQMDATRRRITAATLELHRTVGPAATRVSEIARRAGVERVTVYNHFPDDAALFAACSADWRLAHPAPELDGPSLSDDRGPGLRVGLARLYGWYRETEPMTANVLRDAELLPALRAVVDRGLGEYLRTTRRVLAEPFVVSARARGRVEAAVHAVTDFHFWRALSPVGDEAAAELAAGLVEDAARTTSSRAPRAATRSPSPVARRSSRRRAG